jgi:hypothetical protein
MGGFHVTNYKDALQHIQDLDISRVDLTQTEMDEVLNMNPYMTVSYLPYLHLY